MTYLCRCRCEMGGLLDQMPNSQPRLLPLCPPTHCPFVKLRLNWYLYKYKRQSVTNPFPLTDWLCVRKLSIRCSGLDSSIVWTMDNGTDGKFPAGSASVCWLCIMLAQHTKIQKYKKFRLLDMYSLYPKIKNKQQQNTNMSQPILIYVRLLMYIYLKALLCWTGQVTGQCISIHITTGLTLEIILYNSI